MKISGLIDASRFLENLKAKEKKSAFCEMVDHLVKIDQIPADLLNEVIEGLEKREEKMSTAIGEGIALPHAAIQGLPEVITLIATLEKKHEGIHCQSPDGLPIRVFIMILVPFDQYSVHLRALAAVNRFLKEPGIKKKLCEANDVDQIMAIINK